MTQASQTNRVLRYLRQPVSLAPLAVFRMLFGAVMLLSIIRFASKGWITDLYVTPSYYFTYYGFEWVKPLGGIGMHSLFALMALASIGIMLGWRYRISAVVFFLSFTYVELIDKTNYLNHYYFVSLMSGLMIMLPAHRLASLDVAAGRVSRVLRAPRWIGMSVRFQLGLVYVFAGLAKLNPDWMLQAMPLRIWLPAHTDLPLIGWLLDYPETAYFFSWGGTFYDLLIPFLLLLPKTRLLAYAAVVGFHAMTAALFPIGMFPYIMILATLVFFPATFHHRVLRGLNKIWKLSPGKATPQWNLPAPKRLMVGLFAVFFLLQIALPFRYLLYPGQLFWTEQGYRFSWRVMLMEKAGYAIFKVRDPETGRQGEVINSDFLTPRQEKMMSTQPDMILQFAKHIEHYYQQQGITNPEVRVQCYVTLNGSGSRLFIDPEVDLTRQHESFAAKQWILPFNRKK